MASRPLYPTPSFIPPVNYGMVEQDLYRSGQPNELNFPFLEKLGLRKIIYLAPDDPAQEFLNFVDDQEIDLIHLGTETRCHSWNPINEEMVLEALSYILNINNYPMAIMDHLGSHRVGTVIGCLRKVQRWNLSSIFEEYRRFVGSKVRLMNEQFIELFDTELVTIPVDHPSWL